MPMAWFVHAHDLATLYETDWGSPLSKQLLCARGIVLLAFDYKQR